MKLLTNEQARELVVKYEALENKVASTQEILDSGIVPRLNGYTVRPGKVSDSIFGGQFSYQTKDGTIIEAENPPLTTHNGVPLRIMVRTRRISTHDINRGYIPFKDQILALNHNFMRQLLKRAIGTSQYDVDGLDDNAVVIAAENLKQLGFENVIRAYMAKSTTATSLYQHYIKGCRNFCGHLLPDNLIANGPLPYIIDTPSTKSDEHDESMPPEELFKRGICSPEQYEQIRNSSMYAFGIASEFFRSRGLIGADTKTEHGTSRLGQIVSQDEIWTMDSSRLWLADDYDNQRRLLSEGKIEELAPKSYSKEFARKFSKGSEIYTPEQRVEIAVRYIEGIQYLLGKKFRPDLKPWSERVVTGLKVVVKLLDN
jgi:phosphoribosylaminoimidazole-succinocarboxamide synthase